MCQSLYDSEIILEFFEFQFLKLKLEDVLRIEWLFIAVLMRKPLDKKKKSYSVTEYSMMKYKKKY